MVKHFIVSDEANEEFSRELLDGSSIGLSTYKRAPMQLRSAGIALLGGGQVLSQFDPSFTSNVLTTGIFRIPDPQEARLAARYLNLPEETIPMLQNLGVGQMYFVTEGMSRAVLVKVELFTEAPINLTQRAASEAEERAKLERETIHAPEAVDGTVPISYLEILGERSMGQANADVIAENVGDAHLAFLGAVLEYPDTPVTKLYTLLGLSSGKGNRLKEEAETLGLIIVEEGQSTNGRPPKLLRLTAIGKKLVHDLQSKGQRK